MKDNILGDQAFDILFRQARTYRAWQEGEVTDALIRQLYDLVKMGPTSANCCPARFQFVKSKEAKEKLKPHLDAGNVDKTMGAPVTAIIAYDLKFYEQMPKLAPHSPNAKTSMAKNARETAFRNGSLQGGYLILAARALGLDCGPMSGFNPQGVKEAFYPGEDVEINFLCNIGHGDAAKLFPRGPRLTFEETCKIV